MKKIRRYAYIFLPLFLLIATLLLNLALYFTHSLQLNMLFNSDAIYLPSLYKDLFINNGSFSDWYGSAAPFYFPDMFVYFISNFIFEDYYYAIPFFFTLNSLIIIYILYKIYKHFFNKKDALYLCAISFSVIYLIPLNTYMFQFVSVHHFGQFIAGLISIYLILEILTNTTKNIYITLFIVSVLSVASDSLYIVGFILPTLATILILWSTRILNSKKLIYIYFTLIFSALVGEILNHLLIQNSTNYAKITTLSLTHLEENIQSIISIAEDFYSAQKFMSIIIIIIYICIVFFLFFYKRIGNLKLAEQHISKIFYLSIYLLIMFLGYILSVMFLYPHPVNIRYVVPIFLLPILMFPIIYKWTKLDSSKPKLFRTLNLVLVLILLFILGFRSYEYLKHATFKKEYYPPLVSCIDSFVKQTGAKDGIADYWDSKSINMLSKNNINIVQVTYDLSQYKAVNSISWYRDSYDFALIKNNSLEKKKILLLNGEPTEIFKCNDRNIFYYKNKLVTDSIFKKLSFIYNETILFNSKKVIFKSWSYAERIHLWSLDHSSSIYFRIKKNTPIKGKLNINFGTLGEQKIIVYMNNQKIADTTFNGGDIHTSFSFNPNILKVNGVNIIKFEFPNAHKPNNEDQRVLAMSLKSFMLE